MELFDEVVDIKKNLLPYDGEVFYYGKIYDYEEASQLYENLLNSIAWKRDEAVIWGKKITTKRKVAWYADEMFEYTYSNTTKVALPWTKELKDIKQRVEENIRESFNSCLLNLYHDGTEGMAWHSDGEKDLKKDGPIASVSLGAERKFAFKHKRTKEKSEIVLTHGSLMVMKGKTQSNWLHRLPPTKKITTPRINLTFRIIEKSR